jgi:predicted metal-dependent enzyme (double-stranded beta helix superfamily)
MSNLGRLREFITDFTRLIDRAGNDEETILAEGRHAVAALVATDNWLPESYAQPHPQYYQQYLLHCDPLERFSVVSFVWGPGQATPVHDHTVWGIIGVLRGAELSRRFTRTESGGGPLTGHAEERLERGAVEAVSPTIGDIHAISNAVPDGVSISIHVYGGNIGAISRSVFDPATGTAKEFISGYANEATPNLWRGVQAA